MQPNKNMIISIIITCCFVSMLAALVIGGCIKMSNRMPDCETDFVDTDLHPKNAEDLWQNDK